MDNSITVALYRGTSPVSRIIKGRGRWSHIEGVLANGSCCGAWHKGGVQHHDAGYPDYATNLKHSLSFNHKPGTIVDLFSIPCTPEQEAKFAELMLAEVGVGYDFWSIFCFITRKPVEVNGLWFCSELVFARLIEIKIYLQERILPSEVSPNTCGISPAIYPEGSIETCQGVMYDPSSVLRHQP